MQIRIPTSKWMTTNPLWDEGMRHVVIQRKDGKASLIKNVLLVPNMQCNFLSVGKLIQTCFLVLMENNCLDIFLSQKDTNPKILLVKKYNLQGMQPKLSTKMSCCNIS